MILNQNYVDERGQSHFSGEQVAFPDAMQVVQDRWELQIPMDFAVQSHLRHESPHSSVILGNGQDENCHSHILTNSPRNCSKCDADLPKEDTGSICYRCKVGETVTTFVKP
jgi:hypothetical protein